jgi:hypothetical protein
MMIMIASSNKLATHPDRKNLDIGGRPLSFMKQSQQNYQLFTGKVSLAWSPFLGRKSPEINVFCHGPRATWLCLCNQLIRLGFLPYEDWFLTS